MEELQLFNQQEQARQNNLQRFRETGDKVQKCLTECPNESLFFDKYSLKNAPEYYAKHRKRMVIGTAPILSTVRAAYGDATVIDFLNLFLLDLANFCGFGEKVTGMQIDGISQTILSKYHYLKVSEIMLFCQMAKAGELKDARGDNVFKFYGTFSGDVIASSLTAFIKHRNNIIYEEEEKKNDYNGQWVSAKSQFVAPLLKKMREEWDFNAQKKAEAEAREKQRIIDEHNATFRKMLESMEQIR